MEVKPQIYIAGALTAADPKHIAVYETIDHVCAEAGFLAYLPHRDTGPRNNVLDPREVFLKNSQALQNSIAVIAEVSTPSFGVGMECEYALRSGVPLIPVARKDSQVSRMLEGHPSVNEIIRYATDDELRQRLLTAIRTSLCKPPRRPGLFVAFEGMDGTGKSTLAKLCSERYAAKFPSRRVVLIADPPTLEPWAQVRSLFAEIEALSAQSEAMLLLSARMDQTLRAVLPILQGNGLVFSDRFHDSWIIYQAERLQRHVTHATPEQIDYFLQLATVVARSLGGLLLPDHVFVFTGDPQTLNDRIVAARGAVSPKYETLDFARQIRERYVALYERDSARMTLIDTSRRSFEEVQEIVIDYIDTCLLNDMPAAVAG